MFCVAFEEVKAPEGVGENPPKVPETSRPVSVCQAPASLLWPSAQARKGAALFENSIGLKGFPPYLRPFRNWALGNINDPGAYKADTFKSHYHNTKWNPDRASVRQSGGSISSLPREDATYANTIIYGYNGATVYNFMEETGESETAPPHIWQPVILYLGWPR